VQDTEEPGGALSTAGSEELALSLAADAAAREQLRNAFHEAPLHKLLGLHITEIGPDQVVVEMPVRESAFNSTGNLHGGSLATLIDVAAGTAAAVGSGFQPGRQTIVTADLHVRYLGRPKGDLVRAVAKVLKAGRQLVVVECQVSDDEGRVVAVSDFSSMNVPLRQPLRPIATAQQTHPDI
jgi:uncharacterized protein (TIGR00369 family)